MPKYTLTQHFESDEDLKAYIDQLGSPTAAQSQPTAAAPAGKKETAAMITDELKTLISELMGAGNTDPYRKAFTEMGVTKLSELKGVAKLRECRDKLKQHIAEPAAPAENSDDPLA